MKRILLYLLCAALLLALAACGRNANNTTGAGQAQESSGTAEEISNDENDEELQDIGEPMPPVADAAIYRGVIESMASDPQGNVTVTLRQHTGTNFGYPYMTLILGDNTHKDFDLEELQEGDYLEVYYGNSNEETAHAITASKLPEADMSVYNGTIVEMTEGENEGEGSILLQAVEGENTILFHYSQETQFYLDFGALQEGDALNVYYNGITTRSIPPQATAMEVRPYYSGEEEASQQA